MKSQLVPRKVVLGSSIKFFGLDIGRSDGTEISVEFEVPDGIDGKELKKAMLLEKENLDNLVLIMENAKGTMKESFWKTSRQRLKDAYDSMLGRKKVDESSQPPAE